MSQTAAQLKAAWETSPDKLAGAFCVVLVDFGYDVDAEHVRNWIAGYYSGAPPQGGPAMFVHGWLKKGID